MVAAILIPISGTIGIAAFLVAGILALQYFDLPWWAARYAQHYPDFLAGIVAFWARDYLQRFGWLLPMLLGAFAFWYMISCVGSTGFPIVWFLLIIGFVNLNITTAFGRFGALLGDASYSIYLLHGSVYAVFINFLPLERMPVYSPEFVRFTALGIVCLTSVASWMFFERPMARIGHRLAKRADPAATTPLVVGQ